MSALTQLAGLIQLNDTLRFKSFAQRMIVQEDARITVEVHCDDAIADLWSEADDAGMASAERISLVAEVTLRATPL